MQSAAIDFFREQARRKKEAALRKISDIMRMSHVEKERYELAIASIKKLARVVLHFHPDRLDSSMKLVADSLLESGFYRSQFHTGISNGSVSATPGGERDNWEKAIYGGAYHREERKRSIRP